jgi:hypothetical protein
LREQTIKQGAKQQWYYGTNEEHRDVTVQNEEQRDITVQKAQKDKK